MYHDRYRDLIILSLNPILAFWVIVLVVTIPPIHYSTVISNATSARQSTASTIPARQAVIGEMKMPWSTELVNKAGVSIISFTAGPHGAGDVNYQQCVPYQLERLSGIDFGLPNGTEVLAVQAGKIITATETPGGPGLEVMIDHGTWTTRYWHLSNIDWAKQHIGENVFQGQVIGKSGNSGHSKQPYHLHLELQVGTSTAIDSPNALSWDGVTIDNYTVHSVLNPENMNEGLNYQGTLTRGAVKQQPKEEHECKGRTRPGIKITEQDGTYIQPSATITSTNRRYSPPLMFLIELPEYPVVKPNELTNLHLTIQNTGKSEWPAGSITLAHVDGQPLNLRWNQPPAVPSGGQVQWELSLIAPPEPGVYDSVWQTAFYNQPFGERVQIIVIVVPEGSNAGFTQMIQAMVDDARQKLNDNFDAAWANLKRQIQERIEQEIQREVAAQLGKCSRTPAALILVGSILWWRSKRYPH